MTGALAPATPGSRRPFSVLCCGWAGDKGFTTPELNAYVPLSLKDSLPEGCTACYSAQPHLRNWHLDARGLTYRSKVHLIDSCTTPRP